MQIILEIKGVGAIVKSKAKYYVCDGIHVDKNGRERIVRSRHGGKFDAALKDLRDMHREKQLQLPGNIAELIARFDKSEKKWQEFLESMQNDIKGHGFHAGKISAEPCSDAKMKSVNSFIHPREESSV